jgi:hypothetical protein
VTISVPFIASKDSARLEIGVESNKRVVILYETGQFSGAQNDVSNLPVRCQGRAAPNATTTVANSTYAPASIVSSV